MSASCPHCACTSADGMQAHVLLALLAADDIDGAMDQGLLADQACPACEPRCAALLIDARDARLVALAARERYRARAVRLARRKAEREAARIPVAPVQAQATTLPTAAADVLARALAKARTPR